MAKRKKSPPPGGKGCKLLTEDCYGCPCFAGSDGKRADRVRAFDSRADAAPLRAKGFCLYRRVPLAVVAERPLVRGTAGEEPRLADAQRRCSLVIRLRGRGPLWPRLPSWWARVLAIVTRGDAAKAAAKPRRRRPTTVKGPTLPAGSVVTGFDPLAMVVTVKAPT